MKIEGKVIKYNGNTGIIIDKDNNEYLILKHNIKNDEDITIDDKVIFVPEIFKTIDMEEKVAMFIEKLRI